MTRFKYSDSKDIQKRGFFHAYLPAHIVASRHSVHVHSATLKDCNPRPLKKIFSLRLVVKVRGLALKLEATRLK